MQLFPGYGFQQSAATPVFLGLLLSWALTETLGWAFVGIVVPGYLATLLLVEPRSAVIDIAEAVLTYFVARGLGEYASRAGITSRAFGRERFLLVVLVSVLVRIGVEGLLLPAAFSQPSWAYSIGLVVVPLAANACWKTGLPRGVVQTGVPVLLVYALLRWVLIPYTSLSLAGFHLLTEDVAASFLASPKAYFVLLTGALLSSFANVRWGWDFGGILVPALLGLVVLEPTKLLSTGAEALVLLVLVHGLLTYTPIGRWNVEGPRRIVLFASVDYALRFGTAWLLGPRLGSTGFLEITGFGYLLPALLAVKASQKRDAALVLLPTALLSGAAFAVGTLVGFSFEQLAPAEAAAPPGDAGGRDVVPPRGIAAAVRWSAAMSSRTRQGADERNVVAPHGLARAAFRLVQEPDSASRDEVFARDLDDGVCWFGERFAALDRRRGGPSVLLRCRQPRRPGTVLLLAAPLASPASAVLAGDLLAKRVVEAVVVAGAERGEEARRQEGSAAQVLAARLARLAGGESVVVELSDAEAGAPSEGAELPASLRDALRALDPRLVDAAPSRGRPLVRIAPEVVLPSTPEAAPPRVDATCGAAASALDGVSLRAAPESPEELLALRRLVLEPLLSAPTNGLAGDLALSAARDLGFETETVLRGESRTVVAVLTPTERSPRLGLIARVDGGGDAVVELTHGDLPKLRRFAAALGASLDASAVLVTFGEGSARDGGALLGQALALSTWARAANDRAVVRLEPASAEDTSRGVAVGSWDGRADGSKAATLARGFARLGLPTEERPIPPSLLEAITRREPVQVETFVVTPSDAAVQSFGFATSEEAARPWPRTEPRDADCGAVAAELARGELRPSGEPLDLGRLALAATRERSVSARRTLEHARAEQRVGLALVRAESGLYLAAAAPRARGALLACVPLAGLAERPTLRREGSVEACARAIARGGMCESSGGSP